MFRGHFHPQASLFLSLMKCRYHLSTSITAPIAPSSLQTTRRRHRRCGPPFALTLCCSRDAARLTALQRWEWDTKRRLFTQSCRKWGFKGYWQWQRKMWDGEGRGNLKGFFTLIAIIMTCPARKKTYRKPVSAGWTSPFSTRWHTWRQRCDTRITDEH